MMRDEERKMEGISLTRALSDVDNTIDSVVRLDFNEGSAFYQTSTLDSQRSLEDLNSRLEKDLVAKMLRAGMDHAGTCYVSRRELPRMVEVWPSKDVPCLELRAYHQESKEPENWRIALDLIQL